MTDTEMEDYWRRIANDIPDGEARSVLATLIDWLDYLDTGECPECGGGGFKMCSPPICIRCGWQHPHHEQAIRDVLGVLSLVIAPCQHGRVSPHGVCWRCGKMVYRYTRSVQAGMNPPRIEGSNDRETWVVIRDGRPLRPA